MDVKLTKPLKAERKTLMFRKYLILPNTTNYSGDCGEESKNQHNY